MAQVRRLLLQICLVVALLHLDVVRATDSGLTLLNDLPSANQIPLLDNRFRIDDGIESITLVMFRRPGTASVVLVRPDGSKIFYNTAKDHGIRWYDAPNYDLIEINNPMPGPWQAVGRLLPESRIVVLTEVQLHVDPLPAELMVGETFKLTARLKQGEAVIDTREFKDIVTLQVFFVSTNNKDYENFGRGIIEVTTFRDDGRGYDASARDGIFTGEINLAFGAGEWIPKYSVKTPLYTREIEHAPIIVAPAPVKVQVAVANNPQSMHQVQFLTVSPDVDSTSLLFQGQIRYPDGEVMQFAVTEATEQPEITMENRGPGSYILNVSVFGKMLTGRDFVLNLPEERFLVAVQARDAPALPAPEPEVTPASEPTESPVVISPGHFPWFWVVVINLLIFTTGAVAIWLVVSGKSIAVLIRRRKQPVVDLPGAAAEKGKTNTTAGQKNHTTDDILDLSLPDD